MTDLTRQLPLFSRSFDLRPLGFECGLCGSPSGVRCVNMMGLLSGLPLFFGGYHAGRIPEARRPPIEEIPFD